MGWDNGWFSLFLFMLWYLLFCTFFLLSPDLSGSVDGVCRLAMKPNILLSHCSNYSMQYQ